MYNATTEDVERVYVNGRLVPSIEAGSWPPKSRPS
jgi:hypothetical protein